MENFNLKGYLEENKLIKETEDYESLREKAESFLDENYFHLKTDLRTSKYEDVISALVDYKKEI
jgi:hypothetical protein